MSAGLAVSTILAASDLTLEIAPGPEIMTEDERALSVDLSKGIEHGVVLTEELDLNEEDMGKSRITYHLRAKILAPEGAELSEIEIQCNTADSEVHNWWGKTILPNGTVLELKRRDLREETMPNSSAKRAVRYLKGILPGVTPGCIVDLGYSCKYPGIVLERHLPLQRKWLIRKLAYRWAPYPRRGSSSRVSNAEAIGVQVTRDGRTVLVTGSDIPPFHLEPWMPPIREIQPEAIFYYPDKSLNFYDFWNDYAHRLETRAVDTFEAAKEEIQRTITSMSIPADADLEAKLRRAYTWILDNIENLSLRPSEEVSKLNLTNMADVLREKKAGGLYIDYLFMMVARALGAEAHMVEAPDRTRSYWSPGRKDKDQLSYKLVGVGPVGTPYEKFTVVSPGDKLPYGEVPWWLTGTQALIATPKGSLPILIPASTAGNNMANTAAVLSLSADSPAVHVRWTRRANGQTWYRTRKTLQALAPMARKELLSKLCGAEDSFDVSQADVQGLSDPREPFVLSCEGQILDTAFSTGAQSYAVSIHGAWLEAIPKLTESKRTYPVIFDMPHADIADIEVKAPTGYIPKRAPPRILLDGRFGNYQLVVTTTSAGYKVHRAYVLGQIKIDPQDYQELRNFLNDALQADRTRLVFEKASQN